MNTMERVVKKFASHAEADRANRDYYRSLTPDQRAEILVQMMDDYYGPQPRLERTAVKSLPQDFFQQS